MYKTESEHGHVQVIRTQDFYNEPFMPHDRGIPVLRYFNAVDDSFDWISEGPKYFHHVQVPFEGAISLDISGNPEVWLPNQRLTLEVYGRKGVAPRTVKGHHFVTLNSDELEVSKTLGIYLGDYNDPIFYCGSVWLNLSRELAYLMVSLNPNDYTVQKLQEIFLKANNRLVQVIEDILEGKLSGQS